MVVIQRVVLLSRVSTDSEDQLNSLETQQIQFHEFVKENNLSIAPMGITCKRKGDHEYTTNGIFAEEGLSGKSMKRREATKYLLSIAHMKQFDTVIVKNVPRFGRNAKEIAENLELLEQHGVGVFFQDLKVNSMDRSKNFMIGLFAQLAEEESNAKSISVQVGIRRAQKDGKFTSATPYGYNLENGYLYLNEEEALIVRFIYYLYHDQGFGTGKIARFLNENNVPTKKNTKWSQIQISRFLENPIYTGLQIQHVTQIRNFKTEQRDDISQDEWIKHQFERLRIIDDETFRLVQIEKQERLEKFGHLEYIDKKYVEDDGMTIRIQTKKRLLRGTGRHSNQHLLSNLLYCGNCGNSLKRKKRHGKHNDLGYEWSCRINDMYGSSKCAYRNAFPEEYIIDEVKFNIEEYRKLFEQAEEHYLNRYIDVYKNKTNGIGSLEDIRSKIDILENERESNFQLFNAKFINMDEYGKRNIKIQSKIDELQVSINKLKTIEVEIENIRLRNKSFVNLLLEIDFDNMNNAMLRRLIDKVEIKTYEAGEIVDSHTNEPIHQQPTKMIRVIWKYMDTNLDQMTIDYFNSLG